MKLVDMKLPKKSKKEMKEEYAISPMDEERYPYGLRITFEQEQLKDLPYLKEKKVGDKCMIYCEAVITDTRMSERQNGKTNHSVGLQIEKVDVKPKKMQYSKKMTPKEYKEYRENNGDE